MSGWGFAYFCYRRHLFKNSSQCTSFRWKICTFFVYYKKKITQYQRSSVLYVALLCDCCAWFVIYAIYIRVDVWNKLETILFLLTNKSSQTVSVVKTIPSPSTSPHSSRIYFLKYILFKSVCISLLIKNIYANKIYSPSFTFLNLLVTTKARR